MPRSEKETGSWMKARKSAVRYEKLSVPFVESFAVDGPHQLSLPFPGATVPAILLARRAF